MKNGCFQQDADVGLDSSGTLEPAERYFPSEQNQLLFELLSFEKEKAMKKKSYKITCSLKEGYQPKGKLHRLKDAETIIREWMENRLENKEPIITGLLQEGTLFFPQPGAGETVVASPTVIFTGELSEPEDLKRADKEVKATLESLAIALKERLKQESVFIVYLDKNWCV